LGEGFGFGRSDRKCSIPSGASAHATLHRPEETRNRISAAHAQGNAYALEVPTLALPHSTSPGCEVFALSLFNLAA